MIGREIKVERVARRAASFKREEADQAARTVPLAFSSEEPVERYWGVEILGHAQGEAELDWLSSGRAPLLLDHDATQVIGVVERATIGGDRVGRAVVRFGPSARAEEVLQDVLAGIRPNVSVGYELLDLKLVEQGKDKADTYRATKWRPLELSIVSIPADMTVGVGRDAGELKSLTINLPEPQPETPQETRQMQTTTTNAPAAPAPAPVDVAAIQAAARVDESKRVREILALGARHQLGELADKAVADGVSLADFRGIVLGELDKRGSSTPLYTPASEVGLSPREARNYSLLRMIRARVENKPELAGFELECHRALEAKIGPAKRGFYVPLEVQQRPMRSPIAGGQRDLTVGTSTAGGFLVGTELQPANFIELLRARMRVAALGARMLNGLVGNVNIPRQTGGGTAYWLANEATAATESQLAVGQLALVPKNVAAYTEISKLLTMQSTPDAEMLVQDDLALVLALAMDAAAITGTGASGQPTGIINTAGIGAVTGTTIGYAGIVEFQTDVAGGNALVESAAYLTTPTVAGLLMQRQRFASTDTPLWTGSVLDGVMAGFRATSSTQVPAANMLFGDFAQVVMASWGVLEVETNPYANFPAGIIGVRAWATVDVGIRQAAAFSLATGIT